MSRLQDLIDELCPDGVEHVALKNVCDDFIVPMRDRPKEFNGNIPWCRIEDIEGLTISGSKIGLGVTAEVVKDMNLKVMPVGTVIASCSASLGRYAISTVELITNQTFIGLVCSARILNKFLLHVLPTKTQELMAASNSGTIPYISRKKFEELVVPLPPLEVQEEIVRILDTFTALEAELEAELEARKKQNRSYGDRLLNFEGGDRHPMKSRLAELCPQGVPFRELSEIASIGTGSSDRKNHELGGEFPFYVRSREVLKARTYEFDETAIIIPGEGGIGDIFHFASGKYALHQRAYRIAISNNRVNSKFIFYYLRTNFKQFILAKAVSATVTSIRKPMIERFSVPVPPMEVQDEIVRVLDACTELEDSVEAELNARRQQYEHYRDKLLTFKEAS